MLPKDEDFRQLKSWDQEFEILPYYGVVLAHESWDQDSKFYHTLELYWHTKNDGGPVH